MAAVILADSGMPAGAGSTAIKIKSSGPAIRASNRWFISQKDKTPAEYRASLRTFFQKKRAAREILLLPVPLPTATAGCNCQLQLPTATANCY
jgi:hypothetical protein